MAVLNSRFRGYQFSHVLEGLSLNGPEAGDLQRQILARIDDMVRSANWARDKSNLWNQLMGHSHYLEFLCRPRGLPGPLQDISNGVTALLFQQLYEFYLWMSDFTLWNSIQTTFSAGIGGLSAARAGLAGLLDMPIPPFHTDVLSLKEYQTQRARLGILTPLPSAQVEEREPLAVTLASVLVAPRVNSLIKGANILFLSL